MKACDRIQMPKNGVRARFLGHSPRAVCGICECSGPAALYDVDHIVPRCHGGPDLPWNLWALCLQHHRLKSLWERKFEGMGSEPMCWACGRITSKFWRTDAFWCPQCASASDRLCALRERTKKSVLHYQEQLQKGLGATHLASLPGSTSM